MRLYQVHDSSDMAGSDTWLTSLKEVQAHLEIAYGITERVRFDAHGEWSGDVHEDFEGGQAHVVRHTIKATAADVAWALQHLPCR